MQNLGVDVLEIAKMQFTVLVGVARCLAPAGEHERAGHVGRIEIASANLISRNDMRWRRIFPPPHPRPISKAFCAFDLTIITAFSQTVIHHKRASRYVVLGEILRPPFTEYIFIFANGVSVIINFFNSKPIFHFVISPLRLVNKSLV